MQEQRNKQTKRNLIYLSATTESVRKEQVIDRVKRALEKKKINIIIIQNALST